MSHRDTFKYLHDESTNTYLIKNMNTGSVLELAEFESRRILLEDENSRSLPVEHFPVEEIDKAEFLFFAESGDFKALSELKRLQDLIGIVINSAYRLYPETRDKGYREIPLYVMTEDELKREIWISLITHIHKGTIYQAKRTFYGYLFIILFRDLKRKIQEHKALLKPIPAYYEKKKDNKKKQGDKKIYRPKIHMTREEELRLQKEYLAEFEITMLDYYPPKEEPFVVTTTKDKKEPSIDAEELSVMISKEVLTYIEEYKRIEPLDTIILDYRLSGLSQRAIAEKIEPCQKTVCNRLKKIRAITEEYYAEYYKKM